MLTSAASTAELIRHRAADYLMPDAPRVGGITPYLKIAAQAEQAGVMLAPALRDGAARASRRAYPDRALGRALRLARAPLQRAPGDPDGRMLVPLVRASASALSDQARAWTREKFEPSPNPPTQENRNA
jgi:hypothetical protein